MREGDVIVLIGTGPSGTGMQETAQITTALRYLPWGKHVALITDGRFSGVSTGACIGHIGPEALDGGPIGRVRDDDLIEIVIDRNTLTGSVNLVGADGERRSTRRVRGAAARPAAASRALRPTRDCPTTAASGRRCSARAAAHGAGASTTSIGSSPRSIEGRATSTRNYHESPSVLRTKRCQSIVCLSE